MLSQGNLNNDHFYLKDIWSALPEDCIGGSNAASAARRTVTVDWGGHTVVTIGIEGMKKLFRKRGWVREFFAQNGACLGDRLKIEAQGPYHFRVSVIRP